MSVHVLSLALSFVFFCCSARAQDTSRDDLARAKFFEGRAAYDQRDYERALGAWQASYEISQRPELLYNVGLAAQKLGRVGPALEAFDAYLTWGKGERADEVRGRVEALRDLEAVQAIGEPPAWEPAPRVQPVAPITPVAAARAARPAPIPSAPPRSPERAEPQRSSARGWWIAAGVVLAAAAIAVGIAVPLSQRDDKPDNMPNTGLTVDALRWAP